MTIDGQARIRMTVLGGFLGSGKTTWLRHQLYEGVFGDALVIVNEAADTAVDDALLARARRTEVLAGGCACCDGRAGFLSLLRRICDERSGVDSTADRLSRIVLETSGLADPGSIIDAVRRDPVLVSHIVVTEAIVAVEAPYGLNQLLSEPLARRQIEIADRLIVTKIDAAEADATAQLVATLRAQNPHAEIAGAVKGAPAALPSNRVQHVDLSRLPDSSGVGPLHAITIRLDREIDWTAFAVWLSALLHARGHDVVRVKGVVRTPAGRLLLQSVRNVVQAPEILVDDDTRGQDLDDRIVCIGRNYSPNDLGLSLRNFAGVIRFPGEKLGGFLSSESLP